MDLQQLEAWRESAIRVVQYNDELKQLKADAMGVGNGMSEHATSRDSTPKFQRYLERQERTREKYNRACKDWKEIHEMFVKERYKLSPTQRDIIYMRFALAQKWKTIEQRLNMTTGSVKYQYRDAVERLLQNY